MSWLKRIFGAGDAAPKGGPFSPEDAPATTAVVPTDVATLMIFNPDDLQHAANWPIAWYAEPGIWQHESAAGNLIAWCTRADGGYRIRMRHGPLTKREHRYAVNQWTFPFTVRHGRVFMDNSDCLPGQDQMEDAAKHEACWLTLPNGPYLATVHGIDWEAEPGARDMGNKNLPNYVVTFIEQGDQPTPAIAHRPPDISGNPEQAPTDAAEFTYSPPADTPNDFGTTDFTAFMPAGVSTTVKLRGTQFYSEGESMLDAVTHPDEDDRAQWETLRQHRYIMAPQIAPGALAVICSLNGRGGRPGAPLRYSLYPLGTVRIDEVAGTYDAGKIVADDNQDTGDYAHPLHAVRVTPVYTPRGSHDAVDVAELRSQIVQSLTEGALHAQNPALASYHAHRVAVMDHVMQLTSFLTSYMDIDPASLLEMDQTPLTDQVAALRARL